MFRISIVIALLQLLQLPFSLSFVRIQPLRQLQVNQINKRFIISPRYIIEDVLPYQQNNMSQIEDDGYSRDKKYNVGLFSKLKNVVSRVFTGNTQPGILILVRHGESTWNNNKTFTGWVDADLSERGRREVEHAARLLLEQGFTVDITYTSRLKRAIRSTWILLRELNQIYRPVFKSYRLNERMYGALEGLSKPQLASELGAELVQSWRSGLLSRPPSQTPDHPYWHQKERKYSDLSNEIPVTESLQDTMERTLPLWHSRILPEIRNGKNVLIVAHGNSLRGIVNHIDKLTTDEIQRTGIPNGIPLVYKFNKKMEPIPQPNAVAPLTGEFLEKKGLLRAALEREAEWAAKIPGYEMPVATANGTRQLSSPIDLTEFKQPQVNPYIFGLIKLDQEKQLLKLAAGVVDHLKDGDTNGGSENENSSDSNNVTNNNKSGIFESENDTSYFYASDKLASSLFSAKETKQQQQLKKSEQLQRAIRSLFKKSTAAGNVKREEKNNNSIFSSTEESTRSPVLVIIRHGKTEYNKLGLFTGWEDAQLAAEGRAEAQDAGKLLKKHGIEFDVVYTSWLSRAIETAWLVLDELDSVWLPMVKSWRLNERMYGALTGLSKKMVGQRHGDKQLKLWRRSYATRPPKISSFSSDYPGNDERYVKYIKDMPISFFETFIRSLAHGKFELHRSFPKTESLRDCMERTIPYFKNVIYPESIAKGKNVLIASSENAIRGLLMHLCDIPSSVIHEIEIPTGLPLIFDFNSKCIRLLDDDKYTDNDPFLRYNFGSAPELLFLPQTMRNEYEYKKGGAFQSLNDGIEMCFITEDGRGFCCDPILRLPSTDTTTDSYTIPDTSDINAMNGESITATATTSIKMNDENYNVNI